MSIGAVAGVAQAAVQGATGATASSGGASFSKILSQAINDVSGAQTQANTLLSQYAMGGPVTIDQVMNAVSRAELLTEAAGAVTTRAVTAYQSLMQTNIG